MFWYSTEYLPLRASTWVVCYSHGPGTGLKRDIFWVAAYLELGHVGFTETYTFGIYGLRGLALIRLAGSMGELKSGIYVPDGIRY
jgi:hypothetical protein